MLLHLSGSQLWLRCDGDCSRRPRENKLITGHTRYGTNYYIYDCLKGIWNASIPDPAKEEMAA